MDEKQKYSQSGLDKWFNVLLCRSDLNEESLENRPVAFKDLFKYGSRHDKILVWTGITLAILTGIIQPFSMFFAGKLANILILYGTTSKNDELWESGYRLVLINTIVGLLLILITFAQYFCLKIACQNIIATLRSRFIESILRQDARFFDENQHGTLNSQLNESINLIQSGIAEKIGLLLRGISMFFTTIVISLFINWRITLSMIAVGPISCITMSLMARFVSKASKKQGVWLDKSVNVLQESIMNVKTVQACNGQDQMIKKYSDFLDQGRIYGVFTYFWNGFFDGCFFLFMYIFYGLGICYGAVLYYNGYTSGGDVLIVTNSILIGSYLLGFISPHMMAILKARVAAATIYSQIERVPNIDCYSIGGVELSNPKGHIKFENVEFSYPSRPTVKVLKGVTFEAEAGKTLGLVGHSGCGKSSCISLLNRLYDFAGKITIDGVDIKTLNIRHLRTIIGNVEQHPVLFSATLYENITMGDKSITQKQVEWACRIAHAEEFIERLEKGYNTLVGFGGVQLSGGQCQRISIARAIIHDPSILLLDEATSALDAESEICVQSALMEACKNRTVIVIAHRLSTLRDAQKIIVLSDGKVKESGTHDELMEKGDHYANLVKAQQFETSESTKSFDEEEQEVVTKPFDSTSFIRSSVRSSIRDPTAAKVSVVYEDDDVDHPAKYGGLLKLYRNCDGHYGKLAMGTLFSLLRGIELPGYVFLMNLAFIAFQNKDLSWDLYQHKVFWLFVASAVLAVICCLTIFGSVGFYGWATENIADMLKIKAFRKVLGQGAVYFDNPQNSNAKLLKRINTDSISIKAALDNRLYHFTNNVNSAILEIIMAFFYSVQVSLVGSAMYTILSIILWFLAQRMRHAIHMLHLVDDSAKLAVEIIEHTRTIQLANREKHFLHKYEEHLNRCQKWEFKIAVFDALTFSLTQSAMFLSDSCCFALGIYLVYYGHNDANQVFVSCQTMSTLSWALLFISLSFVEILHAIPACESLFSIIDAHPTLNAHESDGVEPEIGGNISIEKVTFAYPNRRQVNVLNGLNISVNKGEVIALVGPSGSGKSSIMLLLERFYELRSGELLIDQTPIHKFKLSHLRKKIGLVSQHPILFSGSIFENICLGSPNATIDQVKEACRTSNAQEFVERLPNGYETQIGPKQLSGGQRQRLCIARALVKDPRVLLLDESTSALDTESERKVQEALDQASKNRTTIIIAHRLSSIEKVDKIYFIANGQVKEAGTHLELLARNGLYAEMIKKQSLQS